MTDKEKITALAKTLYWGYLKGKTGTAGKWGELDTDGRKFWRGMAKRAFEKLVRLNSPEVQAD